MKYQEIEKPMYFNIPNKHRQEPGTSFAIRHVCFKQYTFPTYLFATRSTMPAQGT